MNKATAPTRVAVIGAGMAGATCARWLADAGVAVQVFEKSRGPGGRMATRRTEWAADEGVMHPAAFDHGAPGFTARSADFVRFVQQARSDGLLARWAPAISPRSYAPLDDTALWLPSPDMPALCRALLAGVPIAFGCTVSAIRPALGGWHVEADGEDIALAETYSEVIVAIPPPQAAPLLQPHRPDWAHRAQALPMLPGWTLMGVTADVDTAPEWDLAWPAQGPLSWIVRNDAKPGRQRLPGFAHWVAHASASWSQTHLEAPAADVQAALQGALAQWLGRPLRWHHAAVHRWRYGSAPRAAATITASDSAEATARCWWDASRHLGVCGDALGGAGVEGAWTSGRALAMALIDRYRTAASDPGRSASTAR